MERVKLTPRLRAAAEMIEPGARVADVGTDHGYLPVWLRQNDVCRSVIASDIRPGPLEAARASAAKFGADGIDFRLCAGLSGIRPEEADTVVLAGMSGETMIAILKEAAWDWSGKRLLLQPMTKRAELLSWLYAHSLHLAEERFAAEQRRYYWILRIEAGKAALPRPAFLYAGLTETEYARRLCRRLSDALRGLRSAEAPDEAEIQKTEALLEDMKDAYGW